MGEVIASGADLIGRERRRQVFGESYSERHDDLHQHDELVLAAVQYALPAGRRAYNSPIQGAGIVNGAEWINGVGAAPIDWPWENSSWKPTPDDRVRELVKAGALIAAEIDRLARAR